MERARGVVGERLRDVRLGAGLTARALAALTGQHFTRVSKIENGVQPPTVRDIRLWCRACRVEEQAGELIAITLAVRGADAEAGRRRRAGLSRVIDRHGIGLHERTRLFRLYEHAMIPSLIQTAGYCAAVTRCWMDFLDVPGAAEPVVSARMAEQEVLSRRGKQFVVLLEEQALYTRFGSVGEQSAQGERLLEVMVSPAISIAVIPRTIERTSLTAAAFSIFDEALVTVRTPAAELELTDPARIEQYVRMFERLRADAVTGDPARELIARSLL